MLGGIMLQVEYPDRHVFYVDMPGELSSCPPPYQEMKQSVIS
jgi:hypothetical protein